MRKSLEKASDFIDRMNEAIGKGISWLTTLLVVLICGDVAARYLFNISSAGVVELEWHVFSFIFLLGAAYTLRHDKHVRVDVFYQNFSPRKQAWVNLLGSVLFLIPFCLIIIQASGKFTYNAFMINEGSPDPGGLPARFIVKGAIPVGFFLLLLQAFSLAFRSILTLTESTTHDHA